MATEVPEHDYPARDRHQIQTTILAAVIPVTVLFAVIFVVAAIPWFNRFGFLHFPIGFYLLAQGLVIFIVVMAFWFIRLQERLDVARSETEGLG